MTVINDTTTFPAVGAGGFTNADTPFLVLFGPGIRDAAEVTFQLDVTDGSGNYLSE